MYRKIRRTVAIAPLSPGRLESDGGLFHRGRFLDASRVDGGERWIVIRVPVGGYVEEMWVRATDTSRPAQRLRVWTDNQSLDAKPSYVTDTTYLRTPPPPRSSTVADAIAPPTCWSCLLGG